MPVWITKNRITSIARISPIDSRVLRAGTPLSKLYIFLRIKVWASPTASAFTNRFVRTCITCVNSLSAADILNQIYSLPEVDKLTNIVFMGQGEPMDNLDNVLRATDILTASYGWAWSPKRITVSSVGVRNKLKRFLEESQCHVAISMHSPIPEQRAELMPAQRGMSIEEVVDLLRNYDFSHQRRLTFEYIVFGGVNDSTTHAREIIKLLKGLDCRINLIRFHQIPEVALHGADEKTMENFRDYLTNHGIHTTIRASRGQDIFAACGLLSTSKKIGKIRHDQE